MAQGFKQRAAAARHKARQLRNHAGVVARERREDTDNARLADGARSGKSATRRKGSGPVMGMESAGCARRSGLGSPLVATGDPACRATRAEQQEAVWGPSERSPSCLAPVAGCYAPTAPNTRRRTWGATDHVVHRVAAAQATARELAGESGAVVRILSTE